MIHVPNQKEVVDFYGTEPQARLAMEEAAELIQAINKVLRKKDGAKNHLAEEMADVFICLEQLQYLFGISDTEIQVWIDYKLERQKKRIAEKEK